MKLWTKNFTIITVGTLISKFGNSIAGFAMGLLVLDYTGSTFLYALYMILYFLPQIIMPTLAGPFIDKFSRRKTIYTLDFISAGLYGLFALVIFTGHLNFGILMVGCLLLGAIDSVYMVAYDSFFPMLITEGNYGKAYSIASTLESFTMFLVPVSAVLYNLIGIGPLFLIDMGTYLVAALMETRIRVEETYVKKENENFGFQQYRKDFREGMDYLKSEKGLWTIALYFMITSFAGGASNIIGLPYFRETYRYGEYIYILVMGCSMLGRVLGGAVHYKLKLPVQKKFFIAIIVYLLICIIDGSYLFLPIPVMMVMLLASGLLSITSYNIRLSGTQSYVPVEKKGRFNGTFQMLNTVGVLLGQFFSGLLADFMDKRWVLAAFMIINFIGVWVILYPNRKAVKEVYNRET